MSVVATLLIALAASDLVGGQLRQAKATARWAPSTAGVIVLVAVSWLAGLLSGAAVVLVAVAAVTIVAWQFSAARAFATDRHHWAPLLILAVASASIVALAGFAPQVGGSVQRWLAWVQVPGLSNTDPDRLLLIAGLLAIQISTANVVVRLVLRHVGAMKPSGPQPSDRLRGGRLLGPMERLVIVGLGLAGQVTAASLVIAAKGLIRWPELQRATSAAEHPAFGPKVTEVTIDEVTEYFLVGSFVSWLIALGAVGIAALG